MACNCLKEHEQTIVDHIKKDHIENKYKVAVYHNWSGIQSKILSVEDGEWKFTIPVKVGFVYMTQKGKNIVRNYETNIHPPFCPFCGRKYNEEKIEIIHSISSFSKAINFFKENIDFKVPDNLHAEFYTWLNKQGSLFFMSATIERTDGYVKYLNPKTLM